MEEQSKQNIFEITNLQCQYGTAPVVLRIPALEIPSDQLIFVLGVSGVGKSTLIETLGLMNRTIVSTQDCSIKFYPNPEGFIELKDSWKKDNKALSAFRTDYFSFIFQNTNLMPNFSAGENMCITQLMRGDSLPKARERVVEVMDKLNLPPDAFDKRIFELSGGQRQRLAFVRAVTSDFKVLFGDEPTGNLDKDTSFRLMKLLKKAIKGKSSIIVSHDIELATEFADRIVLLTPEEDGKGGTFGTVLEENLMVKKGKDWLKGPQEELIPNPENFIYEKLIYEQEKSPV